MNFKAEELANGYIDGLGNRFDLEPDSMSVEYETSPLKNCFSYIDFKRINGFPDMEVDQLSVDEQENEIEIDTISEDQRNNNGRGPNKYYSEKVRVRFWHMVIEEGCSAYKAAKINDISLQTAYTWKRNWNKQVFKNLNGIYKTPKKRGRKT
ncbi:uncharacterized protein RJT21DRAFT_132416 [Scheffersomyces amazonensis]|uniref:uncharacterized protein n=1 Tax=Scheffersomyces amazonensis TaxID=1078765 RepID=UPI00315D078E